VNDATAHVVPAYDLLRHEILHGGLMAGERLRAADLRTRYGLGLTPIREALLRLATEGLVRIEANRGARVSAVSVAELRDLMRTRRAIEGLCLRAAIERGGPEWEADILRAMHLLERAPVPRAAHERAAIAHWQAMHQQFHRALVAACDSPWMLRIWADLADHSERYRKLRLLANRSLPPDERDVNVEHRAIMEAVLARDPDRAVARMDAHLSRTEALVEALLAEVPQFAEPEGARA
jgi:DNA-binding GntR family transcriptional regulator